MNALKCDQCGAVADPRLRDWLIVNQYDDSMLTYGDPLGPWHFDSPACLAEWAIHHTALAASPGLL